jgi:hypothetical protein
MPSANPPATLASPTAPLAPAGTRLQRLAWRLRGWHRVLIGGGLALLLLPYLALAFYNQPYWDDYDYATLVARLGSQWAAHKYLYLNHTGRFFALWFTRVNPLTYGWPEGVRVLSLVWIGATGLAQALALRVLSRGRLGWWAAAGWSAALLLGQLYVMPSPNSAFYWFSSAMVYQPPAILGLVWPVLVLQSLRARRRWARVAWYVLAAVVMLCVAGAIELSLLLLGWSLAWLCYLAYRRADRPALRRWLGLAALTLVAGVVVVAAPGNLVRLHHDGPSLDIPLWKVAGRAVLQTVMFLTEPRQVTALVVAPILLARLGYRYRHVRPAGLRLPLAAGLAFVVGGVVLQMLFLSLTTWGYPAVRVLNFVWFGLFTSWLLVLWAALPDGSSLNERLIRRLRLPALLYVLVLAGGGPERAAWREWLENAPRWQRQLAAREATIRQARAAGARMVSVPPLVGIQPQYVLILGETLSPQASARYNQDAAKWYGLDSLRLSRPGLAPADVRVH